MMAITQEGQSDARKVRLFVAYVREDEGFVEGFLLQALQLNQEEVLRSTHLELGAPIVEEIARGALSPVTVVVMSPSFLASPWARFANQLATHRSVEGAEDGSSTVVPAMVADCAAPLLTRFKVALDFRPSERAHWEAEVERLRKKLAEVGPRNSAAEERCPYPGMPAFAAKDAADFHGRRMEIEEALGHLRAGVRELYVIGPSGSGKSSLIAAGVVPKLQSSPALAGGRYLVRTMRPGAEPVVALARTLEAAAEDVEIGLGAAASSPRGAKPDEGASTHEMDAVGDERDGAVARTGEPSRRWKGVVRKLLARNEAHDRVLLFVDQLEELFTTANGIAQEGFEEALRQLREDERMVLVLTLRADFYGALMESVLWREAAGGRPMRLDVVPLRGAALREAVEVPARSLGVYYEPVLVERLLQEVEHEAGALPLLQDTLVRLWHARTRGLVRLVDYERLGDGVHSGLAMTVKQGASRTLNELTPERQQLARRVLLRLVQFGEGDAGVVTRRQQTRAALSAAGDEKEEVDAVVHHLADRRLVTTSDVDEKEGWAARVDLAHEVLLTAWPTLREWIQTRREDELRRRVLEGKAAEWVRSGGGQTRLLDAEELQEVRGWLTQEAARELGTSEEALALVAASEAAKIEEATVLAEMDRQRRQVREERAEAERQRKLAVQEQIQERLSSRRRLVRFVVAGLVVASLLGLVAWRQREEARQQFVRNVVERARSQLLEQSNPMLAIHSLEEAIALGAEDSALRTVLVSVRNYVWRIAFLHEGPVGLAAFSPDGTWVVTASLDGTVQVWNATTGAVVSVPFKHKSLVNSAAFSADGIWVVTASEDGTVRVWDVTTGRLVRKPLEHQGPINSASFSADGAWMVTAGEDGTAQVWDVATWMPVAKPLKHQGPINSASFSADGAWVVTASEDGTARVWNAVTGQSLGAPLVHQDGVKSAVFNSDGTRVVTASDDGTAGVWDAATGKLLMVPFKHQDRVNSATFSPNSALVVTASDDGTAQVWDAVAGRSLGARLTHQDGVRGAAFNSDGTRVVTASDDGTARVWDAATGRPLGVPFTHQDRVRSAAFSPDGTRVVTASDDGTARVWDAATGQSSGKLLAHQDAVNSAAFSPDGTWVVTASDDKTARIWEVATGRPRGEPLTHQGAVNSAAFSPDGARVVTASDDGTAQVWDATSGRPLVAPFTHKGAVNSAAFSADGAWVVTASDDRTARVWDVMTGLPRGSILVHRGAVNSAVFRPDGARIVTASDDGVSRVWDVATGLPAVSLSHHGPVNTAVFSPDGVRVVTASDEGAARIWAPPGLFLVHRRLVNSAAFSPNGALVVTASDDRSAQVWDAANGRPLGLPLAHQGKVRSAAFSSNGTLVVTASRDGTARVWEATTGRPLGPSLEHQGPVNGAAFSPDSSRVVTVSEDRTARVWDIAETGSLAVWKAQAASCMMKPLILPLSKRCQLFQRRTP